MHASQVAGYICTHFSLPDDQCFDLLIGALGLGFVLSLASAIPIFYGCKLMECSHRDQPPAAQNINRAAPTGAPMLTRALRLFGMSAGTYDVNTARR